MNRTGSPKIPAHLEANRIFKDVYKFATQESKGNCVIYDEKLGANRKLGFFERIFKTESELKQGKAKAREFLTENLSNHLMNNLEKKIFLDQSQVAQVDWRDRDFQAKETTNKVAESIIEKTLKDIKSKKSADNPSENTAAKNLNSIKNHWLTKSLSNNFSDKSSKLEKRKEAQLSFLKNIKGAKDHKAASSLDLTLKNQAKAESAQGIVLDDLKVLEKYNETLQDMEDAVKYEDLYEPRKQLIDFLETNQQIYPIPDSDRKTIALYVAFLEKFEKNVDRDFLIKQACEMKNIEQLIGKDLSKKIPIGQKFQIVMNASRATEQKFSNELKESSFVNDTMKSRMKTYYESKLVPEALIYARKELHDEIKSDFKNLQKQATGFKVDFDQVIGTMLIPELDALSNLGRLQAAINYKSMNSMVEGYKSLQDIVDELLEKDRDLYAKKT